MFKVATVAAILIGAAAPVVGNAEERSFESGGQKYVYTTTQKGNVQHIQGRYYPGGHSFDLEVRNGRVEGTMHDRSVAFPLSRVAPSDGAAAAE
jgi:hypothetical protein